MKKIFILISLLYFTPGSTKAEEYSPIYTNIVDTPGITLQQLQSLDLTTFYNLTVETLISHLPPGYNVTGVWGFISGTASHINIVYPCNVTLSIFVKEFTHMLNYNERGATWDISLFRKEKIFMLELFDQYGNEVPISINP